MSFDAWKNKVGYAAVTLAVIASTCLAPLAAHATPPGGQRQVGVDAPYVDLEFTALTLGDSGTYGSSVYSDGSAITLTPGGDKDLYFSGSVSTTSGVTDLDPNVNSNAGWGIVLVATSTTINSGAAIMAMMRSGGEPGAFCAGSGSTDRRHCIELVQTGTTVTGTGGSTPMTFTITDSASTTMHFAGKIELPYYADQADGSSGGNDMHWVAIVYASHDVAGNISGTWIGINATAMNGINTDALVSPLVSFQSLSSDLQFGTTSLGNTTSTSAGTFTNDGNVPLNITAYSQNGLGGNNAALLCSGNGSIPVTNLKMGTSFGAAQSIGTHDSQSTITPLSSFDRGDYGSTSTVTTVNYYLTVPSYGVSGNCTSTIYLVGSAAS